MEKKNTPIISKTTQAKRARFRILRFLTILLKAFLSNQSAGLFVLRALIEEKIQETKRLF